jgi:hypothetical protein
MNEGKQTMKTIRFMSAIAISIAMLASITSCKQEGEAAIKNTSGGGVYASWAKGYNNIGDMATDSQLIAIGVIDRVVETIQMDEYSYETSFAFRIEQVLKGEESGEILLHQTGTPGKPWSAIVDDPLFQTGERYLLFLRSNTPGIFFSSGGPNGRYKILDDNVYSMNNILQNNEYTAPEALDFNGVALTTVIDTVTEAMEEVRFLCASTTRLLRGESVKKEVVLATGKYGEGTVVYTISRVDSMDGGNQIPMPEGMEITIEPVEFTASPYSDYTSVIEIKTDEQTITPGEYWISVNYDIGGAISGHHLITIYIDSLTLSEIEDLYQ